MNDICSEEVLLNNSFSCKNKDAFIPRLEIHQIQNTAQIWLPHVAMDSKNIRTYSVQSNEDITPIEQTIRRKIREEQLLFLLLTHCFQCTLIKCFKLLQDIVRRWTVYSLYENTEGTERMKQSRTSSPGVLLDCPKYYFLSLTVSAKGFHFQQYFAIQLARLKPP